MTEETARRFNIKLRIGGHDATDYINPYLKELTYTDSADGEADDLQFTLHDRDGHWCNDWQPTKGTKVKCTAVCKGWEEPGKDIKLLCGGVLRAAHAGAYQSPDLGHDDRAQG